MRKSFLTLFLICFICSKTSVANTNNSTAAVEAIAETLKGESERINTADLLARTIGQIPDCLEYCITGAVFKMKMTPLGPRFFWTLSVAHNSPDYLTMTHPKLDDSPLTEFNVIFGPIYKKVSEILFQTPLELVTKVDMEEMQGSRTQHKEWGETQTLQFSEATVLGHPASLVFSMFGGGGGLKPDFIKNGDEEIPCKTHGCLENENSNVGSAVRSQFSVGSIVDGVVGGVTDAVKDGVTNYLLNWPGGSSYFNLGNILKIHNFIKNAKGIISTIQSIVDLVQTIGSSSAGVGVKMTRFFCPVDIVPYEPYYLSGIDSYAWRMGYPVADPEKSLTILNPFSKDVIGRDITPKDFHLSKDNAFINKLIGVLKKIGLGKIRWGHEYPREGTVNTENTAKMAAVVASRAVSILSDEERSISRIYNKPPNATTIGAWSRVVPFWAATVPGNDYIPEPGEMMPRACKKNIVNIGDYQHADGTYAYTSWMRHSCDLASGTTILKIPMDVCITKKISD